MSIILMVMLYFQFSKYISYPTLTKVDGIINSELDFPAVTICNLNTVKRDVIACNGSMFRDRIYSLFEDMSDISILEHMLAQSVVPNDLDGELLEMCFKNSSHQLKTFLGHCVWEGTLEDCSDIFTETLTEYGVCFTFNDEAKPRARTRSTGSTSGLHVLINIEQDKYFFSKTLEAGVKVSIMQ